MRRFLPSIFIDHSSGSQDKNFLYGSLATVWLIAVASGLWALMSYANRPGEQGQPLATWPETSGVARSDIKPTLILFAHPQCPCTEATLAELSWLMSRCADNLECHVLFLQPSQEDETWSRSYLWDDAAAIRGVSVAADPDGRIASQFGVRTSGHALLYDPQGKLIFEGGITASRGHRGDSPGRKALLSLIDVERGTPASSQPRQEPVATCSTCVFGCPLNAPQVALRAVSAGEEG